MNFRAAVLDTGPLFDALVLNYYFQGQRYGKRGSSLPVELTPPLENAAAQRQFLELLASIAEKLITPHVIGELHGLERSRLKLYGDNRSVFWRASVDLMLQWRIEEQFVRLLDLWSNEEFGFCIGEIGPPDTALIELALRRNCVLITEDERTLAREAWRLGVDCRLVRELIPISVP